MRTTEKPQRVANIVRRAAEAMGYFVRPHWAQTGTIYLELDHETAPERKIRIADHGECYCSEDWSIDPDGYRKEQVVRFLSRDSKRRVPGWVVVNERKHAALVEAERTKRVQLAEQSKSYQRERKALGERLTKARKWLQENEPGTMAAFYERTGKAGRRFRKAAESRALKALGLEA